MLPVAVYHGGRVQVRPSLADVAEALGVPSRPVRDHYDVAVVGAGPAGLSAALCSASEGLNTLLVEPFAFGGQAGSTSLIRNYLGFSRGVTGRRLASMAYDQCMLFGAEPCFTEATALRAEDGLLTLTLTSGEVTSDVVVVAVGVHYARLAAPGVDELLGAGVFYGAAVSEATGHARAAGVHRRRRQLRRAGRRTPREAGEPGDAPGPRPVPDQVDVRIPDQGDRGGTDRSPYASTRRSPRPVAPAGWNTSRCATRLRPAPETAQADALFIMIGARPHTGWLADTLRCDDRGFILTGSDLMQDGAPPAGMEAWRVRRCRWRPAFPASSPSATSGTVPSSGWPRRSGPGRSRSSSPTSSSPRATTRTKYQVRGADPAATES